MPMRQTTILFAPLDSIALSVGHGDETKPPAQLGSDHDFMVLERWPRDVAYIDRNIFDITRPFPIQKDYIDDQERCGCSGRCLRYSTRSTRACINAQMCTVCEDANCSVGVCCGNRFIPQRALSLFKTSVGYGVFTEESIPAGAFVVEYVGELLYAEEEWPGKDKRYLVDFRSPTASGNTLFVDARSCGNASRMIIHSCAPNCNMEEWHWANSVRLGVFAARDIAPLTELTFEYHDDRTSLFECKCNAPNCCSR